VLAFAMRLAISRLQRGSLLNGHPWSWWQNRPGPASLEETPKRAAIEERAEAMAATFLN
jgi:hypothetical protein